MNFSDVLKNTAFAAAIAAAAGWVLNKIYEIATQWIGYRRDRRAAIIRFFVDIELRLESLSALRAPETAAKLKTDFADIIADYGRRGLKFKAYGVQVSDTRSQNDIDGHLATFPLDAAKLIKRVILLDQQMIAEYDKTQTESFEGLLDTQQLDIMSQWITSSQTLCKSIEDLLVVMRQWPELQKLQTIRCGYTPRRMMMGPIAEAPDPVHPSLQDKVSKV